MSVRTVSVVDYVLFVALRWRSSNHGRERGCGHRCFKYSSLRQFWANAELVSGQQIEQSLSTRMEYFSVPIQTLFFFLLDVSLACVLHYTLHLLLR